LNQREYCDLHRLPLKVFGNWRARFKAEPEPPPRKLLYRRGGLNHTLSHSLSHTLSHVTYSRPISEGALVPPPRDGHRRRFSEAGKYRILDSAAQPDASIAEVARRYGIARRILCRWKQELAAPAAAGLVTVEIVDATQPQAQGVRHETPQTCPLLRASGPQGLRLRPPHHHLHHVKTPRPQPHQPESHFSERH